MDNNDTSDRTLLVAAFAEIVHKLNKETASINEVDRDMKISDELLSGIKTILSQQYTVFKEIAATMENVASNMEILAENSTLATEFNKVKPKELPQPQEAPAPAGESKAKVTGSDLLTFAGLTAVAIGSVIGTLKGWLSAIDFFSAGKIGEALTGLLGKITGVVGTIGETVAAGLEIVKSGILSGLETLAGWFRLDSPAFLEVATKIKGFFTAIIEPFQTAARTLEELTGFGGWLASKFSMLSGMLSSFGGIISATADVVGKIALPIMIIMTAFDTIKGLLDGYATGGVVGALEGAITGFLESLVTAPLDLIKDVVSWVVGAFGFENASEILDSFSFTDLMKSMVGAVFDFASSAVNWVKSFFTWNEENPLFDITAYVVDVWNSVSDYVSKKFNDMATYVGTIPERVWLYAQEAWIDIMARIKKGFVSFGDWLASLPAKLKLAALTTIREYDPTGWVVSEDQISEARRAVTSGSNVSAANVEIDAEANRQRAAIEVQRAALDRSTATIAQKNSEMYASRVNQTQLASDVNARSGTTFAPTNIKGGTNVATTTNNITNVINNHSALDRSPYLIGPQ